jgi:hypothetical protein
VVTAYGINSVKVGMSVDEASRVAGWPLKASYYSPDGTGGQACGSASLDGGPSGVSFMLSEEKVMSVQVASFDPGARLDASTPEGLKLGDPMELAKVKYDGRYTEIPDQYVPQTPKLRVTAEGDGPRAMELLIAGNKNGRVISIQGGYRQWAELAEGCL